MEKDLKHSTMKMERAPSSLQELRTFIREGLKTSDLGEYDRGLFALAVDEVISAVVESPSTNSSGTVSVQLDVSDVAVKVEVEDSENYFANGLGDEQSLKDARNNDTRREIAVYFICEIMDEIYYTFQKGFENRLVMVKFIG